MGLMLLSLPSAILTDSGFNECDRVRVVCGCWLISKLMDRRDKFGCGLDLRYQQLARSFADCELVPK